MNCVNEATWPSFCVKMKKDLQYWYNYDINILNCDDKALIL